MAKVLRSTFSHISFDEIFHLRAYEVETAFQRLETASNAHFCGDMRTNSLSNIVLEAFDVSCTGLGWGIDLRKLQNWIAGLLWEQSDCEILRIKGIFAIKGTCDKYFLQSVCSQPSLTSRCTNCSNWTRARATRPGMRLSRGSVVWYSLVSPSSPSHLKDVTYLRFPLEIHSIHSFPLKFSKKMLEPSKVFPRDDKKSLSPRPYQMEIFDIAKDENTIIFLPTGSGKTFISIMLMDFFWSTDLTMRKSFPLEERKFSIFLAQTVSLVIQQAKYIQNNTSLSVLMLVGEMDTETWDINRWNDELSDKEVLVMTAQVLLNILRRGFFNFSQVKFLVLDECHHARKKHPFNRIMQEFYLPIDPEDRPRVLGLTASPILTLKKTSIPKALVEIQNNLNCRIYSVEDVERNDSVARRSHEEIAVYTVSGIEFRRRNLLRLYIERTNPPNEELRNLVDSFVYVLESEGVKAMVAFIEDCKILAKRKNIYKVFENVTQTDILSQYLDEIYQFCIENFAQAEEDAESTSTKYKCLQQILLKQMRKDKNGIVFVKRRLDAFCIAYLIKTDPKLNEIASAFSYVGHSSTEVKGISAKRQANQLELFRSGSFNLMIATSVAEEGLDIRTCDLVVRFDPPNHLSGYLQSRGRARDRASKFIVMLEEFDSMQNDVLSELRAYEEKMLSSWQLLHAELSEDAEFEETTYTIESSGALLTLQSSVAVLQTFCSALPTDGFCALVPLFKTKSVGNAFACDIELPLNSPIPGIKGELCQSKALAKAKSAFALCVQLHRMGALDDHLMPEREKKMGTTLEAKEVARQLGSRKRVQEYEWNGRPFESIVEVNADTLFYAYAIGIAYENEENVLESILLLQEQLPRDEVIEILLENCKVEVKTVSVKYSGDVCVSKEQYFQLMKYHYILWSSISRVVKLNPEALQFLCEQRAPSYIISPGIKGQIDWMMVSKVLQAFNEHNLSIPLEIDNASSTIQHDTVIYPLAGGDTTQPSHQLFSIDHPIDLKPLDDVLTQSTGIQIKQYLPHNLPVDPSTELHKVSRMAKAKNILFMSKEDKKVPLLPIKQNDLYLPLQYCKTHPLPMAAVSAASGLPGILEALQDSLMACRLVRDLKLPSFGLYKDGPSASLVEAISLSSAMRNKDYERLENLGDRVLKFTLSVYFYEIFPTKDEAQLSTLCHYYYSNYKLYLAATQFKLTKYFIVDPLFLKNWIPWELRDSFDVRTRLPYRMSDKVLADVVEALLGAVYLDYGLKGVHVFLKDVIQYYDDMDERLKHQSSTFVPLSASEEQMDGLVSRFSHKVEFVENAFGYTFKNPLLAIQALTHISSRFTGLSCNQRLEFLGDAIVDLVYLDYLWKTNLGSTPSEFTKMRGFLVGNCTFGVLTYMMGLNRHLIQFSVAVAEAINDFELKIHALIPDFTPGDPITAELVLQVFSDPVRPPKFLGDLFESVLGAIWIDSGCDFEVMQRTILTLGKPFIDCLSLSASVYSNPIGLLYELTQVNECEHLAFDFETMKRVDEREVEESKLKVIPDFGNDEEVTVKVIKCFVHLHGQVIATAETQTSIVSQKECKEQASRRAIQYIESQPNYWENFCPKENQCIE